jgi:hypothetical protein
MAITQEELDRVLGNKRKPSDNINYGSNYNPNPLSNVDILGSIGTQLRQMANNAYVNVPNTVRAIGAEASNDPFVKMFQPITPKPQQNYTVSQAPANYKSMSLGDERIQDAASILLDPLNAIPFAGTAAKGALKGAKYLGKEALRQGYEGTGLLGKIAPDIKMYAYLPNTPTKPNPLVGTRFVSESKGNLVPRQDLKIENMLGDNIIGKPYDNTSAGQLISEVSGEKLNTPVSTLGGDEFPMLQHNFENKIGGASSYTIAKRIADRIAESRKENLLSSGTGNVIELPLTMGKDAEWFSGYPNEIYRQLILQNASPKELKEFNKIVKNVSVIGKAQLRPFGNFKGIETPEGQSQFLTGEGFDAGGTAGEFNKSFSHLMSLKRNQEKFGYNQEDVINSILNPSTMHLPKGFTKEVATKTFEDTLLTPSSQGSGINAYNTDYSALYHGHLKPTPVEIMLSDPYQKIYSEMQILHPNASPDKIRQYTLGALETRKQNVSQKVTQELIDNYYKYHEGLLGR